jgi:predicted nucleic acid-binding protein
MVLVDTSIWIEVFRRSAFDLRAAVPARQIVTCLPVIQEVLQGFSDDVLHKKARTAMLAQRRLDDPLDLSLVEEAIGLYRTARRRGLTIRSSVDCLIAATALRHDVEVVHRDRDFAALATVSALRERQL